MDRSGAKGPRVVVAMSGGVDSSLAAALLVEQGYDVIGATMQIWSPDLPYGEEARDNGCCSIAAVEDARAVADKLGIPYYVLNMHGIFEREVVMDFSAEYARGRTPNPCVRCNRIVKFEAFLDKALALGADFIATGHYARVLPPEPQEGVGVGRFRLLKGADPKKDQTYALYTLTQAQLARTLFPLGGISKERVREMAGDLGLGTANKPDSQEICFIPDNDYRRFLKEYAPGAAIPGRIEDTEGNILGEHQGIGLYTIGQRKGLGAIGGRRTYVKGIDVAENRVIVGTDEELFGNRLHAEDLNLISIPAIPQEGLAITAKIRYSAPEVPAMLISHGPDGAIVEFDKPVRAITPGQAVVFYNGEDVVGGGTISGK